MVGGERLTCHVGGGLFHDTIEIRVIAEFGSMKHKL
jgi:hypothetical protein